LPSVGGLVFAVEVVQIRVSFFSSHIERNKRDDGAGGRGREKTCGSLEKVSIHLFED
jgi:hypothetical protein